MIQRFLHKLSNWERLGARVVHHEILESTPPRFGQPRRQLPPALRNGLLRLGIERLYGHQAEALDLIEEGRHVVVATPTASGKSLIYNLAVSNELLKDANQRALYLFPIKALSRDQRDNLLLFFKSLGLVEPFECEVYDGDTTPYRRNKIRQRPPHVTVTNPDMLHYGLLPFHDKWETLWKTLRFVVIDEMHTYRGVFGSHVAQILRRLQRVCEAHGSDPQFLLLSATIGNPEELGRQLINRPLEVVREQAAPQATRHFLFMNTEEPLTTVAARLVTEAAKLDLKTIVFTRSRRQTELVHMSLTRNSPRLAERVSSYRAGFLPEERRTIEHKLAGGELSAVISTSALEMGIDVGGLDLCILLGYPGTVMTTWQRSGRVGRSGRESAIVLLPQPDALDQYITQHPQEFLKSSYELAVADPDNVEILKAHLPCAAAELPLRREELDTAPEPVRSTVDQLTRTGDLLLTMEGDRWLASLQRPHRNVDLRSVGDSFNIVTPGKGGKLIPMGVNDGVRALKECHPGAVYLHRGRTYLVEELDLEKRVVRVVPRDVSYFTRVKTEKETEIIETYRSRPAGNFVVRLGRLRVTEFIVGYERRRMSGQDLIDTNPLELPPHAFETVGFWIELEPILQQRLARAGLHFMGGIHAVEHAVISMFPLFALCDRNDIGGISIPHHPQVEKGAIFIYDGYPGGIGLAMRGFDLVTPLLEKARELIEGCECLEGCPACIHSPKCGSGNKPLDKLAAQAVLSYLLGIWNLSEEVAGTDATDDEDEQPVPTPDSIPQQEAEAPPPPPPRVGFLDLETQKLAQEVGGWSHIHLMQVSVAVLYDSQTEEFHVYREAEIDRLIEHLRELDLIVGFNIKRFDYTVLRPYTTFRLDDLPTFDMLEAIHGQLGFRLSLDHLAEHTLGKKKLADGIQAVTWFREGRFDDLIAYCREDVAITRDLFNHAIEKGYLLYRARNGRTVRLPTSWQENEGALPKGIAGGRAPRKT